MSDVVQAQPLPEGGVLPPPAATDTAPPPPPEWRVVWGEREVNEHTVTGAHIEAVSLILGPGWDIEPTRGPRNLIAWLAALFAVETGRPLLECLALVRSKPAGEILDAFRPRRS